MQRIHQIGIAFDGVGGGYIQLYAMTSTEADTLRTIVHSARPGGRFHADLWTIVQEELPPFFHGDRTAENTARIIQNRVQTYLSERE